MDLKSSQILDDVISDLRYLGISGSRDLGSSVLRTLNIEYDRFIDERACKARRAPRDMSIIPGLVIPGLVLPGYTTPGTPPCTKDRLVYTGCSRSPREVCYGLQTGTA